MNADILIPELFYDNYYIDNNGTHHIAIDNKINDQLDLSNCKNCGAPLHGYKCEYCGTEYIQS